METHEVVPVGGRNPIQVDVRIVAATHRAGSPGGGGQSLAPTSCIACG
ncbi:MAG: sigma 54-interacting transcriptional regulator [Myxococcota bacterium]